MSKPGEPKQKKMKTSSSSSSSSLPSKHKSSSSPSSASASSEPKKLKPQQRQTWLKELQKPPEKAVQNASIRMNETCDDPSGFCDLLLSEACHCPHLEKFLPNGILDLEFCTNVNGPKSRPLWLADPIHALHLSSQLEDNSSIAESSGSRSNSSSSQKTSPWMYGEEQQRMVALSEAGIPGSFFPLRKDHVFHQFNVPNPNAPKSAHVSKETPNTTETATNKEKSEITTNKEKSETNKEVTGKETNDSATATATTTSAVVATGGSVPAQALVQPTTSVSFAPTVETFPVKPSEPPSTTSQGNLLVTAAETKQDSLKKSDDAKKDLSKDDKKGAATTISSREGKSNTSETKDVDMKDTATENETAESEKSEKGATKTGNDQGGAAKKEDHKKEQEKPADDKVAETKDNTEKGTVDAKMKETAVKDTDDMEMKDAIAKPADDKDVAMKDAAVKNVNIINEPKDALKEDKKEAERVEGMKKETNSGNEAVESAKDVTKECEKANAEKADPNNETSNDKVNMFADDKGGTKEAEKLEVTKAADDKGGTKEAEKLEVTKAADDKGGTNEAETVEVTKAADDKGGTKEAETVEVTKAADVKVPIIKEAADKAEGNDSTMKDTTAAEKLDSKVSAKETIEVKTPSNEDPRRKDAERIEKDTTFDVSKGPELAKFSDSTSSTVDDKKEHPSKSGKQPPLGEEEAPSETTKSKPPVLDSASTSAKSLPPNTSTNASVVSTAAAEPKASPASNPATAAATTTAVAANVSTIAPPKYHLSEARYQELHREEEQIRVIRTLLAKRHNKKKSKKRKVEAIGSVALQNLPGSLQYSNERAVKQINDKIQDQWKEDKAKASQVVEPWLEHFRSSRRLYWKEEQLAGQSKKERALTQFSESGWTSGEECRRSCDMCRGKKKKAFLVGDEIMQCLECPFVGCAPTSVAPYSRQHILQHLFLSGHKFAVTCGAKAEVFCFPCGDFVYHMLFDQERERIDLEAQIPWQAWNDHPIQRSFDPLQFAQVEEYGIVWRGLLAKYPPLVPAEHVDASRLCLVRKTVFEGDVFLSRWPLMGRKALDFAIHQNNASPGDRWMIPAPVGMFNLGNTCFMSSILQCLVHCVPLQRYFLKDIGHNHKSCEKYRQLRSQDLDLPSSNDKKRDKTKPYKPDEVCLACEMDFLYLRYFSRATGRDVVSILQELSARPRRSAMALFNEISSADEKITEKGAPIVIAKMLAVAWKSGGMGHLAGYQQFDAAEFLHAFLDILGRKIIQHRARVDAAIAMARCGNLFERQKEQVHHDIVKHLFEGTLRSVLVCEECGSKRTLSEPFLNVSLPLSTAGILPIVPSSPNALSQSLSVDRCLEHFTSPEKLTDPVDCPSCGKKTPTKKQHTFSRLPRVLCVHLKRFNAALNKKIDDFVAFPAYGLNMGSHLPHWREVTTVPEKAEASKGESAHPKVLYNLFGTVNHQGTLQSGHYVANVKVQDKWYRINDQHVSRSSEEAVLSSDGAYVLFYIRR